MIVELHLDVIAPDEELAKEGLTYAALQRSVELPFAPFIGLRLFLPSNLQENDSRKERYSHLFGNISDPTAVFEVQQVDYSLPSKWAAAQTRLIAREAYEPTLERFHNYVTFLTEFYGFESF